MKSNNVLKTNVREIKYNKHNKNQTHTASFLDAKLDDQLVMALHVYTLCLINKRYYKKSRPEYKTRLHQIVHNIAYTV